MEAIWKDLPFDVSILAKELHILETILFLPAFPIISSIHTYFVCCKWKPFLKSQYWLMSLVICMIDCVAGGTVSSYLLLRLPGWLSDNFLMPLNILIWYLVFFSPFDAEEGMRYFPFRVRLFICGELSLNSWQSSSLSTSTNLGPSSQLWTSDTRFWDKTQSLELPSSDSLQARLSLDLSDGDRSGRHLVIQSGLSYSSRIQESIGAESSNMEFKGCLLLNIDVLLGGRSRAQALCCPTSERQPCSSTHHVLHGLPRCVCGVPGRIHPFPYQLH